jgi:hypothetical protein
METPPVPPVPPLPPVPLPPPQAERSTTPNNHDRRQSRPHNMAARLPDRARQRARARARQRARRRSGRPNQVAVPRR